MPALIAAIEEYLVARNQDPRPFVWTASVASILAKLRDCMVISETIHQSDLPPLNACRAAPAMQPPIVGPLSVGQSLQRQSLDSDLCRHTSSVAPSAYSALTL